MLLELQVGDVKALAELLLDEAPITCENLLEILPQKIELHYAKFAGQEVFGVIPLVLPLEKGTEVAKLQKGTIAYFPDRQFLCIYYGDIEEEAAEVTVIGRMIEYSEKFIQELEEVQQCQGKEMIIRKMGDTQTTFKQHKFLIDVNLGWNTPPIELKKLVNRHGIMQPGGSIIYAEAETRKLGEVLWEIRKHFIKKKQFEVEFLVNLLDHFINRIGGWCGLKESAKVLEHYKLLFLEKEYDFQKILDDLILYVNRLNMWLDLLIPWKECNKIVKEHVKNWGDDR